MGCDRGVDGGVYEFWGVGYLSVFVRCCGMLSNDYILRLDTDWGKEATISPAFVYVTAIW